MITMAPDSPFGVPLDNNSTANSLRSKSPSFEVIPPEEVEAYFNSPAFKQAGLRLSQLDTQRIWEIYPDRGRPDVVVYELFQRYFFLVRREVQAVYNWLPYRPLSDGDDFTNDASIGLLQAIRKFELSKGVKFETYASPNVRGRIIDGLRKLQPFPRIIAKHKRHIKSMSDTLRQKLRHEPTLEEFCEEYGDEYKFIFGNPLVRANVYNQGLHRNANSKCDSDNGEVLDCESDCLAIEGNEIASTNHMNKIQLIDLCDKYLLSKGQQKIIYWYYFMGLNLKRIGRLMKISPSTVSKQRYEALKILRQVPEFREQFEIIRGYK